MVFIKCISKWIKHQTRCLIHSWSPPLQLLISANDQKLSLWFASALWESMANMLRLFYAFWVTQHDGLCEICTLFLEGYTSSTIVPPMVAFHWWNKLLPNKRRVWRAVRESIIETTGCRKKMKYTIQQKSELANTLTSWTETWWIGTYLNCAISHSL
jgi:hypothetical protein